ncbi:biotin transporter BioY [Clostridia bacterium]|nr:biotin transporter BioY [Clostridia bacterium]
MREKIADYSVKKMLTAALFTGLTIVGSQMKIPFLLVPVTFQTFFVILAGFVLGKRYGLLSQVAFVFLGLVGLPVFSGGGGIGYVLKPSFGFILGFLPCSYFIGHFAKQADGLFKTLALALCGSLIVYIVGVPYMYIIMRNIMHIGDLAYVLKNGFLLFIPGDIFKCVLVSLVLANLRKIKI